MNRSSHPELRIVANRLQAGDIVKTRLSGSSMSPRIKSRQLVVIDPCTVDDVSVGDVVYCKVKGNYYLHLVKQVGDDGRVLIGNNHGGTNGWTRAVFGKLRETESSE